LENTYEILAIDILKFWADGSFCQGAWKYISRKAAKDAKYKLQTRNSKSETISNNQKMQNKSINRFVLGARIFVFARNAIVFVERFEH